MIKPKNIARKGYADSESRMSSQLGGSMKKRHTNFTPTKDGDTASATSGGSIARASTKLGAYRQPLISQYSLLSKLPAVS